jgi:hypothetical protein
MANPEIVIDDARKKTQSTHLSFPKDGSINNQQTMISLLKYQRGNPRTLPEKVQPLNIFLPLPMSGIEDNVALQYQDVPLGSAVGGLLAPAKNMSSKILGGLAEFGRYSATSAIAAGGDVLAEEAGKLGTGGKALIGGINKTSEAAQEALGQSLGIATNPNMSLSFQGVELRNHNFTWRLIAKSLEESLSIEDIINTLKLNALPKKTLGAGFSLSYPAIALINFFPANLIKISELGCFITSINVKYDGDGHPVFFKGEKPVIVDLSISFRERAILTADDYDKTQSIGVA